MLGKNKKNQTFLIQASSKTNGLCLPVTNINASTIEYFLTAYFVNIQSRKQFKLPYMNIETNDAVCFCHKAAVKIGWICTACLAIYCKPQNERKDDKCKFCGVTYAPFSYKELENHF